MRAKIRKLAKQAIKSFKSQATEFQYLDSLFSIVENVEPMQSDIDQGIEEILKLENDGNFYVTFQKKGDWVQPMTWPRFWKVAFYDRERGNEGDIKSFNGVTFYQSEQNAAHAAREMQECCANVDFWPVRM